jgi:hypothetical protein
MTLRELPEGTPSRPKVWQKAEMASDMATRSAYFRSVASASTLQFLTDSSGAVSNLVDSRTTFFRRKEKNGDENKVSKRGKHTFGSDTLAWADQADPTATARPSARVPARAVASGSGNEEHPLRRNFPRKSFSTKTTFVHLDCVSSGVSKTSDSDLERQGRPSRGTPTHPGYGYLTRHLPGKAAHARINDSATDEQVLMLETRGKKHGFIPKCSGLSSHKEQTHVLG